MIGPGGVYSKTLQIINPAKGLTWVPAKFGTAINWTDIDYGGGYFVAVNGNGVALCTARSPNGIDWTEQNGAAALTWQSVAYGDGVFMAIANNGVGNQLMRSADYGLTWVSIAEPSTRLWTSICYAGNNTFVACASDGVGNQFARSTDLGLTWVSIAEPVGATLQWQTVFANQGSGVVIALANNGVGNQIARSTDRGATWNSIAEPGNRQWTSVTWGKNIWAGIANDTGATGTGGMYSLDDGVTWNLSSSVYTSSNQSHICFGDNKFVSSRDAGGGSSVLSLASFDAIFYIRITNNINVSSQLKSVVWGLDRFVMIGANGIAYVS